jgi:hypothetical protein
LEGRGIGHVLIIALRPHRGSFVLLRGGHSCLGSSTLFPVRHI